MKDQSLDAVTAAAGIACCCYRITSFSAAATFIVFTTAADTHGPVDLPALHVLAVQLNVSGML
eukprot:7304-Heterococcus_DN1.PRE.4